MIALSWFLLAWLVMLGLFFLVSLITLITHLRYGVANIMTYFSTMAFVSVTVIALLFVGGYLTQVDWTQSLDLGPSLGPLFDL